MAGDPYLQLGFNISNMPQTTSWKYIGNILDEWLAFEEYFRFIWDKINKTMGLILKNMLQDWILLQYTGYF